MREPWFASASQLAREIREGRASSSGLLEQFLGRVDRLNGPINAIVVQDRDRARRNAAQADRAIAAGEPVGPLHGVPITIKESNDWAGTPSTWGYPQQRDNIATQDSVAVARLQRAGAVVFGKTNVPVALGDFQSYNELYGVTRNPWNPARVPGGSSGGAAAALAAGLTGLELGSDIGGSIRNPAHFCGVFGHKPTWNLVPPRGHDLGALRPIDLAVVGPMARSAEDLEVAMRVLAGPDEIEAGGFESRLVGMTKPVASLRVAVWASDDRAPVEREVSERVRAVATRLAEAGAQVDERARPDFDADRSHAVYFSLLQAALGANMGDRQMAEQIARVEGLDASDQRWNARTARAQVVRHRDWVAADEIRTAIRWSWHRFFSQYDFVLMPVMPVAAFEHDHGPMSRRTLAVDGVQRPYFDCLFWAGLPSVAYLPSTVIPTGKGREGLPIGVQIVGPAYGDLKTIQLARFLESRGFGFTPPSGYG